MKTFKNYLNNKLKDPAFNKQFDQECTICPVVVSALKMVEEKNLSLNIIAQMVEVPESCIQALFDGDHCEPALISRIYKALNLECGCRKL